MVIKDGIMVKNIEELIAKEHFEDLKEFSQYLGIDYEDYLEFLHPDVDFDDFSRWIFMEQNGWISKNMEWAVIPYGKKFMSIYKGKQISVHNTIDTAKKFIQRELKKQWTF